MHTKHRSIFVISLLHRPTISSAFTPHALSRCKLQSTSKHHVSEVTIAGGETYDARNNADPTSYLWPPNHPTFIAEQIAICESIVSLSSESIAASHTEAQGTRSRFIEHPRCTARFGEVLMHAYSAASSHDERQIALRNAVAVLSYVQQQHTANGCMNVPLVCEGLIENVADALTSPWIRAFRIRQLSDDFNNSIPSEYLGPVHESSQQSADFIPEYNELEILGRLYYSAIRACEPHLHEVGLSLDHMGFTVLLALCRATAASLQKNKQTTKFNDVTAPTLSTDGLKLDASLSCHFNGITAQGLRFLYSPQHGLGAKEYRGRSKRLIIAFSSLGNGLVRFEFGGSLGKLNRLLYNYFLEHESICNEAAQNSTTNKFDILFVADPSQSWYQKSSSGSFSGFKEYEKRIRIASRPYSQVSIVGDSMGGSAALLFSHLATDSVLAFSPQTNLNEECHVSRDDMTQLVKEGFRSRLFNSVEESVKMGVRIRIHRGIETEDVKHTNELMGHLSSRPCFGTAFANHSIPHALFTAKGRIEVIQHADCYHHQIAVHLKEKAQLVSELSFLIQSDNTT